MDMRVVIVILGALIMMFSCESDPNLDVTSDVNEYTQLKTGNYWVYDTYDCDTLGNNCNYHGRDSVYVSEDTVIDGKYFVIFKGTRFGLPFQQYLRDSANFIVNEKGTKLFAHDKMNEVLHEHQFTLKSNNKPYRAYYGMEEKDRPVSTPAGSFDVLNYRGVIHQIGDSDPVYRYTNRYYSKGVGIVLETARYHESLHQLRRELVKYNVK